MKSPPDLAAPLSAALLTVTLLCTATLTGCGQKGPLYLPKAQKTQVPAGAAKPAGPTSSDTQPSDTQPRAAPATSPATRAEPGTSTAPGTAPAAPAAAAQSPSV